MIRRAKFRKWLNEDESLSAFIAYNSEEGTIKIADCNRIVSLEFYIYSDDNTSLLADNCEKKIDLLYEAIKEARKDIKKRVRQVRRNLTK